MTSKSRRATKVDGKANSSLAHFLTQRDGIHTVPAGVKARPDPLRPGAGALDAVHAQRTVPPACKWGATAITAATLLLGGVAHASAVFSDDFNRPDSDLIGNGWLVNEDPGTDVDLHGNALHFAVSDNAPHSPVVSHTFPALDSSQLPTWSFDFDWTRIGSDAGYTVFMQLGDSNLMSDNGLEMENVGVGVNLVWSNVGGYHETLAYAQGSTRTPLDIIGGHHAIAVVTDLDQGFFDVFVDGSLIGSHIALDNDLNRIDTVRFFTDSLDEQSFAGRNFDNVQVRTIPGPTTLSMVVDSDADFDPHTGDHLWIAYTVENTSAPGDANNLIEFAVPAGTNQGVMPGIMHEPDWTITVEAERTVFSGVLPPGESKVFDVYSSVLSLVPAHASAAANGGGAGNVPFPPVPVEVPGSVGLKVTGIAAVPVGGGMEVTLEASVEGGRLLPGSIEVEHCALPQGPWSPIDTITGDGESYIGTVTAPAGPVGFVRVKAD